jgi:hypothetical protein
VSDDGEDARGRQEQHEGDFLSHAAVALLKGEVIADTHEHVDSHEHVSTSKRWPRRLQWHDLVVVELATSVIDLEANPEYSLAGFLGRHVPTPLDLY